MRILSCRILYASNLHDHQLCAPGYQRRIARDNSRSCEFLSRILGYLFYNSRSCFPNDRFSGFGRDDLSRFSAAVPCVRYAPSRMSFVSGSR